MKKMLFARDGERLAFARILDFIEKDDSFLFFDWEKVIRVADILDRDADNAVRWLRATIDEEDAVEHVILIVKTDNGGYLVGASDGTRSNRWYHFDKIPVVPVDYTEITKEAAIQMMLSKMPHIRDFSKGTWGLRDCPSLYEDELAMLNQMLDKFLTGKVQRWDFHRDPVFEDLGWLWSRIDGALILRGESYGEIKDVDSLVWEDGEMIAIDFCRGCYHLGVYRQ